MLELDDTVKCDIAVVDAESRKLTSTSFELEVETAAYGDGEITEDENYDLLIKPFNKNSLRTMLRNEKYIGVYRFGDVVVEGGIPAIVDKELFDRVQATFKHNRSARAKNKAKDDYLLTTKVFCGHCGSNMVGESGTSRHGVLYHYYKCANRKRGHNCKKETEKKDWLERIVVEHTVQKVLTPENIEDIATKAMELVEREAADNTMRIAYEKELKDVQKRIKNLLDLMEQGIFTDSTKERLLELESRKKDLETQIARENAKKPILSKERIIHWLSSFKSGDMEDIEYRRRVIDTLVNSIYIYDLNDGKGRRIVFTFNISGQNTSTLTVSDIACFAPPYMRNPNLFPSGTGSGFLLQDVVRAACCREGTPGRQGIHLVEEDACRIFRYRKTPDNVVTFPCSDHIGIQKNPGAA